MARAGGGLDRRRLVRGAVLARALAMAAAARPRRRRDRFCHRRGRGAGAVGTAAHAGRARELAPARPRQRAPPPPGDRDCRRARGCRERSLFAGVVERPCRARHGGGARAENRRAGPARRLARSICAARAGAARLHRHVFCRRRRTVEAHRGGVRLAGRGAAGEFPCRRLGGAAGLYRQAAAGAARHSSRRNGASAGAGFGRRPVRRAGQLDADRALDRQCHPRRCRLRRRHGVQGGGASAGRNRRASLYDHRHRRGDAARRRRGSDLAVQRHSRQSADHRAHQRSANAEPRLAVIVLSARGRLRRLPSRGHLRAPG